MEKLDNKFINRLDDSESLVDILIQLENFLDNLDIYAFKNWFDGEVVDGPIIKKYYVGMVLLYDYNKMPDPEAALILEKHGAKVKYSLRNIEDSSLTKNALDLPEISQLYDIEGGQRVYGNNSVTSQKPIVPNINKVWIIEIMVPRLFIDELNSLNIDVYDSAAEDDIIDAQPETVENKNDSTNNSNNTDNSSDLDMGDMDI